MHHPPPRLMRWKEYRESGDRESTFNEICKQQGTRQGICIGTKTLVVHFSPPLACSKHAGVPQQILARSALLFSDLQAYITAKTERFSGLFSRSRGHEIRTSTRRALARTSGKDVRARYTFLCMLNSPRSNCAAPLKTRSTPPHTLWLLALTIAQAGTLSGVGTSWVSDARTRRTGQQPSETTK